MAQDSISFGPVTAQTDQLSHADVAADAKVLVSQTASASPLAAKPSQPALAAEALGSGSEAALKTAQSPLQPLLSQKAEPAAQGSPSNHLI